MDALPQLARARGDCGMLLRRRGDADKAAELLGSAHDLARRLGMGDVTSSGPPGERALSPT
jgi:hypothetical protein